jgi:hypothetical protein
MASIIQDNLQLIVNGDGREELYDLRFARDYSDNLRDSAGFEVTATGLMAALKAATSTGAREKSQVAQSTP